MIAHEAQPLELRYHRLEVTNRWLYGVVAVVLIALLAMAGYFIANRGTSTQYTDTVDRYLVALNAYDADAMQQLYDPSASIMTPTGSGSGMTALIGSINEMRSGNTKLTRVGDVVSNGQTATYHFTWTSPVGGSGKGFEVFVFNDAGKIIFDGAFLQ